MVRNLYTYGPHTRRTHVKGEKHGMLAIEINLESVGSRIGVFADPLNDRADGANARVDGVGLAITDA